MQQAMETAVHERIARQYNGCPPAAIVLGDPSWHLGVVGIVAAKIAESYHRPTFLLHINGDTARGSGRSIPAFNLYYGLQHCAQWLRQFGGHKYAAGLTMDTAQLPLLQEHFIRFAAATLSPEDLQPILHLDAVLTLVDITPALVTDLERCEPHGAGNPTPLFCAQAVQLASPVRRLGQQGQHARFRVTQDGASLNVVAFHQAEQVLALPAGAVVDIAFTPTINTWRDQSQLELHLRALRLHAPLPPGENH
jgi:single-stranded-DNA-specific exonuclease